MRYTPEWFYNQDPEELVVLADILTMSSFWRLEKVRSEKRQRELTVINQLSIRFWYFVQTLLENEVPVATALDQNPTLLTKMIVMLNHEDPNGKLMDLDKAWEEFQRTVIDNDTDNT